METRRAASLRRRLMWFCILGMFLMAIGTFGYLTELMGMPIDADPTASPRTGWWGIRPSAIVLFSSCTALVVLFACGLGYTVRTRPLSVSAAHQTGPGVKTGRHRLVVALTWITIGAVAIAAPAEVAAQWSDFNWGSPQAVEAVRKEPLRAGYTATNAFGIFFLLACVLVPMRWRESLRIAVPALGVLMLSIVFGLDLNGAAVSGFGLMALAYIVIGTGWSAWRYSDFDARLHNHALRHRYTDLHGQVSEISAELKEARKLHESLFPAPSLGDAASPVRVDYRYQPARQIGGDFLFIHREPAALAAAAATTVVVIDVSGHGVAAALAVNRLHGELLRFFSHYPRMERESGGPGHLLADMNTYACAALAPQGVYATALVVRIDPAGGRAAWASAGHPTAFLVRELADKDGERVVDMPSTATMLGVLPPEMFDADEHSTAMGPRDRLIAYTDGAVESRDARGEDYTPERLRHALVDPSAASSDSLLDHVLGRVEAHRHGRITDDTLLVEVALTPSPGGDSSANPASSMGVQPLTHPVR